ncbi:hypothetical protein GCM10023116_05250 [Kistimonas scapharcae]|uniref:Transposase n=1 Tax=Kistimonas scapharcae TaxID=1036133 RepID=A0ABP8UWH7_9GAMM
MEWSFVGSKSHQRWLFYAFEHRFKKIIAHAFGPRSASTLNQIFGRLPSYSFRYYYTDDWKPYTSALPEDRYVVGKLFTQRIERQN